MAQTKHQIEALLTRAGSQPRHRFGQNFMIDQNLVRLIADAGNLSSQDFVVEVGPGTGTLTEELAVRAGHVLAVEIDRDLSALLRTTFSDHANFRLIEGDALAGKHGLNAELAAALAEASAAGRPRKLVANLPYNIASPLIIELLLAGVDLLAFTVQKEVAERLHARPATPNYGPLSVIVQMLARVEHLRTLAPQAFWPAPSIHSSLVRMTRNDRLGERARSFSRFVHAVFSFRRKMLRKALAQGGFDAERLLEGQALDGARRAEEFSPEEILKLYDHALRRQPDNLEQR